MHCTKIVLLSQNTFEDSILISNVTIKKPSAAVETDTCNTEKRYVAILTQIRDRHIQIQICFIKIKHIHTLPVYYV